MQDGFVKIAAVTPQVRVADVAFNVEACLAAAEAAVEDGAQVVVLPELAITGYTCEDLFWQDALLDAAERGLKDFAERTADLDALVFIGLPLRVNAKLYNVAAAVNKGRVIGLVPKRHIPTYNEFYEGRRFTPGPATSSFLYVPVLLPEDDYDEIPFYSKLLFRCEQMPDLVVGAEICEDLWVPKPPSTGLAQAGATLIVNLSASTETVGKDAYRRDLVASTSARLICAYAYASAGWGESTQDVVYGGHCLVAENGRVLAETKPLDDEAVRTVGEKYSASITEAVIDVAALVADRRRMSTFETDPYPVDSAFVEIPFELGRRETSLEARYVDPAPFVPSDAARRSERCEQIFAIQAHGLAKRLAHTRSRRAVIGVSGGLDSTLALLVAARAFDLLDLDRAGIVAVTMPGFGTTARTHGNATTLADALGADLREVNIADAVLQHFHDIGHDESVHDVTYENSQARERTQILMDLANQEGGLVIGTGDLSELALGWATYNGDHMSMYAVNVGVPKTLVRHLVRYVADTCGNEAESECLYDVLDTPVSPELLPATGDGTISQKTEDLVGPYELHDFFLYQVLRFGSRPRKVYRLARAAWGEKYDDATIKHWLEVFYRRFFAQQFKRSCLPDGPKVGSVAVSPRGDLRMPSDAAATLWLAELEEL